jgi:hypothetical protein
MQPLEHVHGAGRSFTLEHWCRRDSLRQLIGCRKRGIVLVGMRRDPISVMPVEHEAPSRGIAHEVGLEPTGQASFSIGTDQSMGDEGEGAIRNEQPRWQRRS